MRRLKRVGMVVLLAILTTLSAAAKKKDNAKALFLKGQDAEARQNVEAAYNYYKQAYELKPKEINYRIAYQRTMFLAAAAHVHRGQALREEGKLQDALAEFQAAKLIDPADAVIDQEITANRGRYRASRPGPRPAAAGAQQSEPDGGAGRRSGRAGADLQPADYAEAQRRRQSHLRDHRQTGGHQRAIRS